MRENFQIQGLVIADDIRFEIGGKHTIVGAYAGTIVLPSVPWFASVAIRIEIKAEKNKYEIVECIIMAPDNTEWSRVSTNADIRYSKYASALAFTGITGVVTQSGVYSIILTMDGATYSVGSFQFITTSEVTEE